MNETIEKLIASGKEGPWWDFKQTYHQNNAALVHDILCMANVLHDGDYEYILKYRGRVLERVPIVHYRNEGLQFPFPEMDTLAYPGKRDGFVTDYYADVFYFVKNTLPYNLLSHIREFHSMPGRNSGITMPLTTQTKPPIIELPFMVFENAGEKEEKLKFIQSQLADFCPDGMPDPASMKTDPELRMEVERQFSWWVFNHIR